MPSESKQLTILKALTTWIEGVTPGNGYDFDLTSRVFRGRAIFGDGDAVPAIAINEHLQPDQVPLVADDMLTFRSDVWMLLVQGWIQQDVTHPTDEAYNLKAAVEKRLSALVAKDRQGDPVDPTNYLLGKKITSMGIGPGVVSGPRPEVSSYAFFYLPVSIGLAVNVADPFSA